ncbi:hypothetical protein BFX40_05660 [Mesorhizobium sp. SEMIA 3007]|nr:hypothetical protein BFX40_05660 [Mesorhizobium sp. SEMIA 3007]
MQFVDLRRPAALQIVPHRRARLRVDRQHAPRQQFEQPVRQPQHFRQQRRPQSGDTRRRDAGGVHRPQRLVDLAGQDQPPAPIGEFARQRQVGQRHQRVVEVHQKLAPQHSLHVAMRLDRQPFNIEKTGDIEKAGKAAILYHHLALAGAVEAQRQLAVRRLHHIERHHAGQHGSLARPGAQPVGVVDAVLQADHHRIGSGMGLDQRRHLLCRAALDGHQDHIRLRQSDGGIGGDPERVRLDQAIAAFKVADAQSALSQRCLDARPGQQDNLPPGERQATADIAADAAGACDDDPFFPVCHLLLRTGPTIRHENHNVGGIVCHCAGPYVCP